MEWVLILGLYLNSDKSGVAVTSATFTTKERCEAAGKAMVAEWRRGSFNFVSDQARFVCVAK